MQRNKVLETFNFQAFLESRRRNTENGIKGKVDRMSEEERMNKIIAELSEEMDTSKRQWLDLARTNEQYKREDTMEELKGDYQRTIEHTENMMIELDSFLFGSSFDSVFMPTTACIIVQSRNVAPFGIGTKVETCNSNVI